MLHSSKARWSGSLLAFRAFRRAHVGIVDLAEPWTALLNCGGRRSIAGFGCQSLLVTIRATQDRLFDFQPNRRTGCFEVALDLGGNLVGATQGHRGAVRPQRSPNFSLPDNALQGLWDTPPIVEATGSSDEMRSNFV